MPLYEFEGKRVQINPGAYQDLARRYRAGVKRIH
jgi:hypothetical protein